MEGLFVICSSFSFSEFLLMKLWDKEKGPESFMDSWPLGSQSVLADKAPSGRGSKCGIPRCALCCGETVGINVIDGDIIIGT